MDSRSPVRPGYYCVEVQKTTWGVPVRYTQLCSVGSGAYGTVCSAIDQKSNEKVAIKKLYRPFQSLIHAKRAYRELRLLRHIQHDNVISLLNVFTPDSSLDTFQTFYMVMPFVAQDLGHIMKRRRLTDRIITYLSYQLLRGLKYIHSAGIIHRDLKPGNLAVNENCELKILDFGLARQTETEMTGYVVTRWYRAPEIIFNWMHYSQTVDVWSAACILAEMITGKVLSPEATVSSHCIDQLKKILRLTGTPDSALVQKMQSKDAQSYVQGLPPQKKKTSKSGGLARRNVTVGPRMPSHCHPGPVSPFLSEYHDPETEPDPKPYDDSFESLELAVGEWKSLIHMEIMTFDPDDPRRTAI
uniref:mitogen-activated protein kinase n=1 Tax=Neogobius melanostomus TaxID=47308 RepID=A0A8C6WRG7_9GOBI